MAVEQFFCEEEQKYQENLLQLESSSDLIAVQYLMWSSVPERGFSGRGAREHQIPSFK